MVFEKQEFTLKNGKKITIKTPEVEDAEQLLSFIVQICGETNMLLSTPRDMNFTVEQEREFIESNRNGPNYLICAYIDDEIVGDCSLDFYHSIKYRHKANIGIGIKKNYWNLGIGSTLFEVMISLAEEKEGIEQLVLSYLSGNERGKALYTKFGFKEVGIIPNAIKQVDGSYSDEVHMIKYLEK